MNPRASRLQAVTTRDHILDAAVDVMHTLGLGRTTTKEIAQAAGLSEAALYRYFDDKSQLFLCVISERLPQLAAILQDLPGRVGKRTVRANLEEVGRVALPFYEQTLPVAAGMFAEPDLLAKHQAYMHKSGVGPYRALEQLAAYIRAEQRAGRVNTRVEPESVASVVIGACLQRVMLRQFTGRSDPPEADERFSKALLRTLMHGLAPHGAGARTEA